MGHVVTVGAVPKIPIVAAHRGQRFGWLALNKRGFTRAVRNKLYTAKNCPIFRRGHTADMTDFMFGNNEHQKLNKNHKEEFIGLTAEA